MRAGGGFDDAGSDSAGSRHTAKVGLSGRYRSGSSVCSLDVCVREGGGGGAVGQWLECRAAKSGTTVAVAAKVQTELPRTRFSNRQGKVGKASQVR